MDEQIIRRKIRIRQEAYANMVGKPTGYIKKKLNDKDLMLIRERLYYDSNNINEEACNKIYTDIVSSSRLKVFLKKALRKIFYKIMGWYYVPMIEGQIEFNTQAKKLLIDLQCIIDSQQEQIADLEEQVKRIKKER